MFIIILRRGFFFHNNLLHPSCSSPRHAHFKNDTSATYSQPKRKPNSTNRRPNSGDITSNFSPRFLHLVRTIIQPPEILGCKNMCGDVEEEFLKISRAHCRKLLQLDRDKLNHILESEPLKLPKITTVSTVRGCTHKLKRKTVVKLPPVQASWGIKSPSQVRIRHSPGKGRRQTRIPIRESGAEFYNSEPDLVESKLMVEGVRFNLSPRPNRLRLFRINFIVQGVPIVGGNGVCHQLRKSEIKDLCHSKYWPLASKYFAHLVGN